MPAPKKKVDETDFSMKNTKQELLDAYNETLKKLYEEEKAQLKPEQKLKERKDEGILAAVSGISADGVIQETNKLKQDIGGMLNKLTDRPGGGGQQIRSGSTGHRDKRTGTQGNL